MSAERRVAGGGQQRAADRQGNVLLGYLGTSSSITYRPLVIHLTDGLLSSVYFERVDTPSVVDSSTTFLSV